MQNLSSVFEIKQINSNTYETSEYPAHKRNYDKYQIIYVKSGKGLYQIDLKQFPIVDDVIYRIHPGQAHCMGKWSAIEGIVVSFSSSFINLYDRDFKGFFGHGAADNQAIYSGIEKVRGTTTEMLLAQMMEEYHCCFKYKTELTRALLKVFLIRLSMVAGTKSESFAMEKDTELVNRFLSLISSNFINLKKVSAYAEMLCIDPNYLNQKIKTISGYSAKYHIQQCIITEAKRLAIWENLCLKDIAYRLNFDDISHLSRYFKNVSGSSFSQFKSAAQSAFSMNSATSSI
ncbi:transcriptional regulator [Dyadobacter frigoris]|uniref:AraC family transcriptional regulator n=1 Tax=Dyadobacter frigoris TaxID=2576211 RepID=UPI0024A3D675|nr:helix-turn-helix transcriptional regulator [Dyadobacter frigoris]GLU55173.1 transcriptional regulator [Dyadobacter frigoris]